MAFFEVKAGDRVKWSGRVGTCTRTLGMLVFVLFDGETEERSVNAFFLKAEGEEVGQ
jgi:hypothetical protein